MTRLSRVRNRERSDMTELELSMTLGIVVEPEKNRMPVDSLIRAEILYLGQVFSLMEGQKSEIGRLTDDVWAELLPWHSLN